MRQSDPDVGREKCGAGFAPAIDGGLIHVKARVRYRVHKLVMSEDFTPSNEVGCPVCGRPMALQIIRRPFAENVRAFECKPCGLSMTEPESSSKPAIVAGR
jgi:hypothetical protein